MLAELFKGELTHLTAVDPEEAASHFSSWSRDSEYSRLEDSIAARPRSEKAVKEWLEKRFETEPPVSFSFLIRTLENDRIIGEIGLDDLRWSHGECFVGIGLGDRDYWGKGYGTDAMSQILRFAFLELNLHRVSLNVFEYNLRAIRSYEKAGFVCEGRQRGVLLKEGVRYDLIFMGILRDEWLAAYNEA